MFWIGAGLAWPLYAQSAFTVSSPDGNVVATLTHNGGALSYAVQSRGVAVIGSSNLGINTDRGDFTSGISLAGNSEAAVNETYTLPAGKRSTYVNRANERTLRCAKGSQEMHLIFRAYDDGIAFRYVLPGTGNVSISGEASAVGLSGGNITYWGQNHPNNYGYETMLGAVTGSRISMPVLARLGDRNHFVFVAQAASYGHYIVPNFQRSGSTLRYSFPMDQTTPVQTALPFHSPWRFVLISPQTPAKIVESSMMEHLNPPTEPALVNAAWVKAGRASWDFLAGDRNKPNTWIDFTAQMGWEYYLADAGFSGQWGGTSAVRQATAYAASKNVGIIGWAHTRNFYPRGAAENTFRNYADMGLQGAKIDFFDQNLNGGAATNDQEDTQLLLQIRDYMMELAVQHKMVLEFHGCTLPSGERRRYPNFMTAEGIAGLEKRTPLHPSHGGAKSFEWIAGPRDLR
jgi:alpha-glucosidase